MASVSKYFMKSYDAVEGRLITSGIAFICKPKCMFNSEIHSHGKLIITSMPLKL